MINLKNYKDRFFDALYGGNYIHVYDDDWEKMCKDFVEFLVLCDVYGHYPSYNEFLFYLLRLEYDHVGRFNRAIPVEFKDFVYNLYEQVIEYISKNEV